MWQFAKGVVTNSSAKINDLLDSNISSLIQHSAQIDSGNSGGPLLIKSSNKIGYSVVGINTWKAFYRDSTNFAIPSSVIKSMIERINQEVDDDKEEDIARNKACCLIGSGRIAVESEQALGQGDA